MTTMAFQITSLVVVYLIVNSGEDKENIKAPRHWPLCGEVTGSGEFPAQRASNAENASIWWRHHVHGRHGDDQMFGAGIWFIAFVLPGSSSLEWRHNERDGVSNQ